MRIGLVGGIFGKSPEYQSGVTITPETVLADGLRARGHQVITASHFETPPVDVDLVHVHHLSYGAVMAAFQPKRHPLLFTCHGSFPPPGVRRLALGRVLAAAEGVVALSPREAGGYTTLGIPREAVVVIPNGIPDGPFPYVSPPPLTEPVRVLYVGQLIPGKGIQLLVDAIGQLRGRMEVELHLVYHEGTIEPELRARARRAGLQSVKFHGFRTGAGLHEMYAQSHLLALPSLSEALPSVVTEALYVGRPVLATRVGGLEDQIAGFGSVVPPGDCGALSAGLADIVSRYETLAAASHQASLSARERFSVTEMVSQHERFYGRVLASWTLPRQPHGWPHRVAAGAVHAYAARRAARLRSRSS